MASMSQAKFVIAAILCIASGSAGAESITPASTTSTEQSGLFAYLLPLFKQAKGLDVKVVAVGTGQALDIARRGDADALLVHDQAAEEKFVAEGFGLKRHAVMYNDFVLIGPKTDPAATRGSDIVAALKKISASNAPFRFAWRQKRNAQRRDPVLDHRGAGEPARRRLSGVRVRHGTALNMATASRACVLTDRGTWLAFKNRGDLAVLVEGDERLFNQYGVIVVNPAKHPHVKAAKAQQFADWIVSPTGQAAIAAYRIRGEQLFFPNAGSSAPQALQSQPFSSAGSANRDGNPLA